MDANTEKVLKKLILDNAINPLRKANRKHLRQLNKYKSGIAIETINLLHQANKTLMNVNRLLKIGEIVDSATLMRSSLEKIAMGMMLYFDPDETYKEFKDLSLCGKTNNTRPTKVLNNFKLKIMDINSFLFEDFNNDELSNLLNETYEKLCLYTHSSVVVSMMIEVDKNKDSDLFIAFFYLIADYLNLLLHSCLKFLCNDEEEHVDFMCLILGWGLHFSKVNKEKLKSEYIEKYKKFLHWEINSKFNDKYREMIEKMKYDLKDLNLLIKNNQDEINEYYANLLS